MIILIIFLYIFIGAIYSILIDERDEMIYIIFWPLCLFLELFDFTTTYIAKSIKKFIIWLNIKNK